MKEISPKLSNNINLWGFSYFVEISLWGMYFGAQLVERD